MVAQLEPWHCQMIHTIHSYEPFSTDTLTLTLTLKEMLYFRLKEMLYFCLIAGLLCGRAKSLIVPGSIRHFENIYKIVCHN